jgi:hypothetical protein
MKLKGTNHMLVPSRDVSTLTGIIDENLVILDFGRHEGRSVQYLRVYDPDYYDSLVEVKKDHYALAIRRHRDRTFRLYVNPLSDFNPDDLDAEGSQGDRVYMCESDYESGCRCEGCLDTMLERQEREFYENETRRGY